MQAGRQKSPLLTADDGRTLRIRGPLSLTGSVRIPGDKSISHRAIILAAVAEGTSVLENVATGGDVGATRELISRLGTEITIVPSGLEITGSGFGGLVQPASALACGNSGTTMRLGAGLLAGRPFFSVLTGDASLRRRPMTRIVEPLGQMGAKVTGAGGNRYPPLVVRGGALGGISHCAEVASAQVKGALLLAGLQAEGETVIELPGPTRDHTERMLAELGCDVEANGHIVRVRASEPRPFEMRIPGDISSASFLLGAAAVCPGSDITVESVGLNPTRVAVIHAMREMGIDVVSGEELEVLGEPAADVGVSYCQNIKPIEISGSRSALLIDEIPILACLAARADGTSIFSDLAELRAKETDRIDVLVTELAKAGVIVEEMPDGLKVTGGTVTPGTLESHGDHRMAMAFAALFAGCDGESAVAGFDASAVSYPEFGMHLGHLAGMSKNAISRAFPENADLK